MLTIITEDLQVVTKCIDETCTASPEQLHMRRLTQDVQETRRRNIVVSQRAL